MWFCPYSLGRGCLSRIIMIPGRAAQHQQATLAAAAALLRPNLHQDRCAEGGGVGRNCGLCPYSLGRGCLSRLFHDPGEGRPNINKSHIGCRRCAFCAQIIRIAARSGSVLGTKKPHPVLASFCWCCRAAGSNLTSCSQSRRDNRLRYAPSLNWGCEDSKFLFWARGVG